MEVFFYQYAHVCLAGDGSIKNSWAGVSRAEYQNIVVHFVLFAVILLGLELVC